MALLRIALTVIASDIDDNVDLGFCKPEQPAIPNERVSLKK